MIQNRVVQPGVVVVTQNGVKSFFSIHARILFVFGVRASWFEFLPAAWLMKARLVALFDLQIRLVTV